jgi:hypothetical protein
MSRDLVASATGTHEAMIINTESKVVFILIFLLLKQVSTSSGDAVGRDGTGVPPVNHAQDARATFKLNHYSNISESSHLFIARWCVDDLRFLAIIVTP